MIFTNAQPALGALDQLNWAQAGRPTSDCKLYPGKAHRACQTPVSACGAWRFLAVFASRTASDLKVLGQHRIVPAASRATHDLMPANEVLRLSALFCFAKLRSRMNFVNTCETRVFCAFRGKRSNRGQQKRGLRALHATGCHLPVPPGATPQPALRGALPGHARRLVRL